MEDRRVTFGMGYLRSPFRAQSGFLGAPGWLKGDAFLDAHGETGTSSEATGEVCRFCSLAMEVVHANVGVLQEGYLREQKRTNLFRVLRFRINLGSMVSMRFFCRVVVFGSPTKFPAIFRGSEFSR